MPNYPTVINNICKNNKLKKTSRSIGLLLLLFFNFSYGQNNNCESCDEALQYKLQFDNWFRGIYHNWNSSMYINRWSGQSVQITDAHAVRINFLEYDANKMNSYARINYLRCLRQNPNKNEIYNVVITQRNPVGYRGDTRSPSDIIAAEGYFPYRDGPNGQADDMTGHIDHTHSGSFVSTSGQFETAITFTWSATETTPGSILGWVAEFRYNCRSLNIGGVEREGEILTSHVPLDHIICWIPIRAGYSSTGLNHMLLLDMENTKINIDYANTYWNPYYRGDAYWNPQERSTSELFNEPAPLQLYQGGTPVPNYYVHLLGCSEAVEVAPFGIFQKKHRIAILKSGEPILEHYYNTTVFDAGLHVTIGVESMRFGHPVTIKSGTTVFMSICDVIFNQGCILEPGARLIIYTNEPNESVVVNGMRIYAGNKGYIDVGG